MKQTIKEGERRGTVIYFSHGGGPLPILGDQSHSALVKFMKHLPSRFKKPDAIIVNWLY